jgi:hypothetical protein
MHEIAVSRSLAVTVIVVRAYGYEPPSTSGSLVVTQNNASGSPPSTAQQVIDHQRGWDAIAVQLDEALLARFATGGAQYRDPALVDPAPPNATARRHSVMAGDDR